MTTLITGANRGIGLELARCLAASGPVIGTARSAPPDEARVRWETLDVTDPASLSALAARLDGEPIAHLVCNSGIYLDKGYTLSSDYSADLWAQTFAANVTGVFLTVQSLLPNLRAAPNAKIMIISSQMASHTNARGGSYIYRASKAAVLNLGRNLAAELKPEGIAVGIYHPGWVQTEMGGNTATLTAEQSAEGLAERLGALGLENTGCFETYDGKAHVY